MPEMDPSPDLRVSASSAPAVPIEDLQFQRAESLTAHARICVACRQGFDGLYFHAQGQVVCPLCASRIQSGQQAPPSLSFLRAVLYGAGAALAGSILYALVGIITGLEIGLMALVVGYLVGKAIRYASNGLGGRPQQILAVVLTYFAITTSYIPISIYQMVKQGTAATQQGAAKTGQPQAVGSTDEAQTSAQPASLGAALLGLFLIVAAAPFLSLGQGFSGIITLFIIFIGLQRAWRMTARPEVLIMGPYEDAAEQHG